MPIEIRELNIRVSVNQNQEEQDSGPATGGAATESINKDELIAECVEQVMELIKLQQER